MLLHANRDVFANLSPQPIVESTRRVLLLAAYTQAWNVCIEAESAQVSPVRQRCRYAWRILPVLLVPDDPAVAVGASELYAVKHAPHRDDSAINKWNGLRQSLHLLSEPVLMAREKSTRILDPPAVRKR